jgi:magnesium-transporting ATPase (P-type)
MSSDKTTRFPHTISRYFRKNGGERVYENRAPRVKWHSLGLEEALGKLSASKDGLDGQEVQRRRNEFGPNQLPSRKPPGAVEVFLRQFLSPLIYVLLAAALISLLLDDITDAAFIMIVLLINAVIGSVQELKAEKSAEQLQKLMRTTARVRRDGRETVVPAEELVPGDIVLLESGNRVPADLLFVKTNNLSVDESLLTGESMPAEKSPGQVEPDAVVGDRRNMAFAGTTVATGRGVGVVACIGANTEIGTIAQAVTETVSAKPPLLIRLEKFSKQVSYLMLGAAVLLGVVATFRGIDLLEVFFLSVALAVAAIPEGLPVAVTVALAIRVTRMSKRNVLTRRLAAVESLGSCTCIASDKTGTLTVNKQTVRAIWIDGVEHRVSGEGYNGEGQITAQDGGSLGEAAAKMVRELALSGALSNEGTLGRGDGGWESSGDAVDVALLALAYKSGLDPGAERAAVETVLDVPFESERMFAAKYFRRDGRPGVAAKGAIEALLPKCRSIMTPEGRRDIDSHKVKEAGEAMAAEGYRVLAIASGESDHASEEELPELCLMGLIGLIDPPRPEVREAVESCRCAGIKVVMVTGDHPATALAIAKELAIAEDSSQVVTGAELEAIGDPGVPAYLDKVAGSKVFARVTPLQKLEIVDALIRLGNFVAVTGDGVNDAPAMRKANIGVAMGSGTDVAKDTSSIIVTDDNFASIVAGVEEGRYAYDNIRKVTYLLVSTGAAEIVLFLLAVFIGVTTDEGVLILPLIAIQLLWLNVVTNGIQHVALAMEGGDPKVMRQPPRDPSEGIFNRQMVQQVLISALTMGVMAFTAFYLLYEVWGYTAFAATNMVFLLMVMLENVHVFNCRSETESAFRVPISRNRFLLFGVLAAQGVHLLAMQIPLMQEVLRVEPVSLQEWGATLMAAVVLLAVMEVYKHFRRKKVKTIVCSGDE